MLCKVSELLRQNRVPGKRCSRLEKQLAVTCLVLSLPCQHFYATRISFSTFLSLTCLYFLCFLFCAGGRRTRCLCDAAAVVKDGDEPAKQKGECLYSEGQPGHVEISFLTHYQQRTLQQEGQKASFFRSSVPHPLFSTVSALSLVPLSLPFTSHLPLLHSLRFHPLAGRQTSLGWYKPVKAHGIRWSQADLNQRRALSPLPSLRSHPSLCPTNTKILTSLFTCPWPAAPGGLTGHGFAPTLHMVLQRHNDFFEFWLPLDKFNFVHLFGRERHRDEYSCSSHSVKMISVGMLQYWFSS